MTKRILALVVVLAMCVCTLAACGGNKEDPHTHTWQDYVSAGEQGHYQTCTGCESHTATVAHNFDNDSDTDCNNCGFVRDLNVQVQEPDTSKDESIVAELCSLYLDDPTYDEYLTLYDDGKAIVSLPNMVTEEDLITEYTLNGNVITIDYWGTKCEGEVATDDDGNIISITMEMESGTYVYTQVQKVLAELALVYEDDHAYDQYLTLYNDGTFLLVFPNMDEDDWIAEYTIDGNKITLDFWGEDTVGEIAYDTEGNIVSVSADIFGEICVYNAVAGNVLAELSLRYEEDPTYDQDLTLYNDGTFCLHLPNMDEEDWIAEYTISGTEITLDFWGEKTVGEVFTDDNGNIVAIRVEVYGEVCVYGEIPA